MALSQIGLWRNNNKAGTITELVTISENHRDSAEQSTKFKPESFSAENPLEKQSSL